MKIGVFDYTNGKLSIFEVDGTKEYEEELLRQGYSLDNIEWMEIKSISMDIEVKK